MASLAHQRLARWTASPWSRARRGCRSPGSAAPLYRAGTALASSKVTPFVFAAIFSAWTVAYGTRQKKKGERLAAAGQIPGPSHVSPASPEGMRATDLT
jgi:hypothetical protein